MESAIVSTDSPGGLVNSLVGSGNSGKSQPPGGSGLPFAQLLQSQQRPMPAVGATAPLTPATSGAETVPLEPSLAVPQPALDGSWSGRPVPGLARVPDASHEALDAGADSVAWVDPAALTAPREPAPSPLGGESLRSAGSESVNAVEAPLQRRARGAELAAPSPVVTEGEESAAGDVMATDPLVGGDAALADSAEPLVPSRASVTAERAVDTGATRATGAASNQLNTAAGGDAAQRDNGDAVAERAVDSARVSAAAGERSQTSEAERAPLETSSARRGGGETPSTAVAEPELRADSRRVESAAAELPARPSPTSAPRAESASESARAPERAAASESGRVAGQSPLQQAPAPEPAQSGGQAAATTTAAAANVSRSDALSTQARSAQAPQSRRGDGVERAEPRTAVDASDGYHWLQSDADPAAAAEIDSRVGARPVESSTQPVVASGAGTAPSANPSARVDSPAESFAAVKQAVETAQASEAQTLESSEAATLEIDTPVRDAQWSQALAYRVQFMAQQGIQRAQVQLNPTELGPMEITVDVVDDVAQVQITAEHAATREAVEQAAPRLREMMQQSGFNETAVDLNDGAQDGRELAERGAERFADSRADGSAGGSGGGAGADSGRDDGDGGGSQAAPLLPAGAPPRRDAEGRMSFYV